MALISSSRSAYVLADEVVNPTVVVRPFLGHADAPIRIIEFTDYECPYCTRFHASTFKRLRSDFIDEGKVRYEIRDLPLPDHLDSRTAAHATYCALEQGRYWEYRDALVAVGSTVGPERLSRLAASINLKLQLFSKCMASGQFYDLIDADIALAKEARITGVPTFVILSRDQPVLEGIQIVGAQAYSIFQKRIETLLDKR